MTGLKLIGFTVAGSLFPVGVVSGIIDDAKMISESSVTFLLALLCIVSIIGNVTLVKFVLKRDERHHKEWNNREDELKKERMSRDEKYEKRDDELRGILQGVTSAMEGMKIVIQQCSGRKQ